MAEPPGRRAQELGYEPTDVAVRWVLVAVAGGLLFLALAGAALYALQGLWSALDLTEREPPLSGLEREALVPPPPRLQVEPAEDLADYRGREEAILGSYAWVDRDAGIARIPIERAMELLAEHGWPDEEAGR